MLYAPNRLSSFCPCRRENGGNCDIKNLTKGCKVYFPGKACRHPRTWRWCRGVHIKAHAPWGAVCSWA